MNGVSGTAGACYEYFRILAAPASSDVSIMCRGARWQSLSAVHSWERVMVGHLAAGALTFGTPIETTLPALGEFEYLEGIGNDATYVVGTMNDGQVALFRGLAGTPEPFASGTVMGAAASP